MLPNMEQKFSVGFLESWLSSGVDFVGATGLDAYAKLHNAYYVITVPFYSCCDEEPEFWATAAHKKFLAKILKW